MFPTAPIQQALRRMLVRPTATNAQGVPAYAMSARHALAQAALTGCLRQTFYASAAEQTKAVLELCADVDATFIAKTALVARRSGGMKEMPALLGAVLAARDSALLAKVFPQVVDSPRMLRTWMRHVRSGVTGRRSFGSRPRRLIRTWLATRSDEALVRASIGRDPSLADVIRMVHPRPASASRAALHAWVLGAKVAPDALPPVVRALERFRSDATAEMPDVPIELLTSAALTREHWATIAARASWQTLRMNLNTFARHGAFETPGLAERVAARLRDRAAVASARALPHQLLIAQGECSEQVPSVVREALHDAMELAVEQVPALPGRVVVCPDLSSSMLWPLTGARRGATTCVRCVDVAALMTAAIVRRHPDAIVLPFSNGVVPVRVRAHDSIAGIARGLAGAAGGGTNCSAPLRWLCEHDIAPDVIVMISDNESWMDPRPFGETALAREWRVLERRRPSARLVCVDLQPNRTTQAPVSPGVLNVGGFSDAVFGAIERFVSVGASADGWVEEIERTAL